MTVDDYMKLSKRRLAELLAERDARDLLTRQVLVPEPFNGQSYPPCFAKDGICTNPFMDCINCPKRWTTDGYGYTTCNGDGINNGQQQ